MLVRFFSLLFLVGASIGMGGIVFAEDVGKTFTIGKQAIELDRGDFGARDRGQMELPVNIGDTIEHTTINGTIKILDIDRTFARIQINGSERPRNLRAKRTIVRVKGDTYTAYLGYRGINSDGSGTLTFFVIKNEHCTDTEVLGSGEYTFCRGKKHAYDDEDHLSVYAYNANQAKIYWHVGDRRHTLRLRVSNEKKVYSREYTATVRYDGVGEHGRAKVAITFGPPDPDVEELLAQKKDPAAPSVAEPPVEEPGQEEASEEVVEEKPAPRELTEEEKRLQRLSARKQANERVDVVTEDDYVLGDLAEAKVIIVEYSDLECPFCAKFHEDMKKIQKDFRGDVAWVYRHYPLVFHPYAEEAAIAAECVGTLEGNGEFWKFVDILSRNQSNFSSEFFYDRAVSFGVNRYLYDDCVTNRRTADNVAADVKSGERAGVSGTPTSYAFKVDEPENIKKINGAVGYEEIQNTVNDLLGHARSRPAVPGAAETAAADIVIPTLREGDHVRGDLEKAKIVVVEYSDMECPFCARFHSTMKDVRAEYGDDVAWVFRHFPLSSIHLSAQNAAETAECVADQAGEEGFWAFVDEVFEKQHRIRSDWLKEVGESLVDSEQQLIMCRIKEEKRVRVARDVESGTKEGVRGTPVAFFINQTNGTAIPVHGAYPLDAVKSIIDGMLAE